MLPRLLLTLVVLPAALVAEEADGSALLRVVIDAPALRAAWQRVDAAELRVGAAGRLPDPEVEGMGSRMVGPMNGRATMWEVSVRQPLPRRGERAADRARAQAAVAMARVDFAMTAGELAADLAMALAEVEGAEKRIELMETQLGRLDAVLRSLEARLASGGARLVDRLTVQTRIAAMQLAIEMEQRLAEDARADARGRLALAPEVNLPPFAAPTVAEVRADDAPLVQLAAARSAEAEAMVQMARASARPMTAVGLRFERERTAMGDESTVGLAFMSEIPWRSRRYARAEARAAEADRGAAQTDATAARYRIAAALTRVERAEQLAATARRLSAQTLERLNAEYDALVRAVGVGTTGESTVLQTVELLEKATETERQIIDAETAARTARAELWRYAPADLFLNQTTQL